MPSVNKISFGNISNDTLYATNAKLDRLKTSIDKQEKAVELNTEYLAKLIEVESQLLASQNKILQKLR